MALKIVVNGQTRSFEELAPGAPLASLLLILGMKQDRVAVEVNGKIVARDRWAHQGIADDDRVEIVHFVGGGTCASHDGNGYCL